MGRISETVSDVLETWEGQNIFSVKWQKSRAKKEEKGKDNENLLKTTMACNRKKKEIAKYIICGLQLLLLIFARYYKKNLWEIENGIVSYEEIIYSNSKPAFAKIMLQAWNG